MLISNTAPIIIMTGCEHSGWDAALPIIGHAEINPIEEDFKCWHDELFDALGIEDPLSLRRPLEPNSIFIQKVGNSFSNLQPGPILLADSRTIWLLDFWAQFFPVAQFLLFYTPPDLAGAYALVNRSDPRNFIGAWTAASHQFVRFHTRYRSRVKIFDASSAIQQPDAFVDACSDLGLDLTDVRWKLQSSSEPTAVDHLVSHYLIKDTPFLQETKVELDARACPLSNELSVYDPERDKILSNYFDSISKFRQLREDFQVTCEKLKRADAALQKQNTESQRLTEQLSEADRELKSQESKILNLNVQIEDAKRRTSALHDANLDLTQENALMLKQLSDLQNELKLYFVKYQQLNQNGWYRLFGVNGDIHIRQKLNRKLKRTIAWSSIRPSGVFNEGLRQRLKLRTYIRLLRSSDFFDEAWYLDRNVDVAEAGVDPVEHYLRHGAAEGRDPSPIFDTHFYLQTNPDVAQAKENPLVHFLQFGQAEGRRPSKN